MLHAGDRTTPVRVERNFMNSPKKRSSSRSRRASLTIRVAGGLALIWLIFVVFLHIQHGLFPRTAIGGLKMLAAASIIIVLVKFMGLLTPWLWRPLSGNKNKRRAFARSSHTPS